MSEATLKSTLRRALVSSGQRRVSDIQEALSLAKKLAGSHSGTAPGYYEQANKPQPTNSSSIVENLRCMLSDPLIRDSAIAQAAIVKAIRAAQLQ